MLARVDEQRNANRQLRGIAERCAQESGELVANVALQDIGALPDERCEWDDGDERQPKDESGELAEIGSTTIEIPGHGSRRYSHQKNIEPLCFHDVIPPTANHPHLPARRA